MPNFICEDLKEIKCPTSAMGCEFLWEACELRNKERGQNKILFVNLEDSKFLLEIKKKADNFVIKGDKITKPASIAYLHKALSVIKQNYAINTLSSATSESKNIKLDFVIEPHDLVELLAGQLKSTEYGIWNLDYYDEIRLEIGFGGAKHLLYRAQNEPNVLFIGVEIYRPGVLKASRSASELGLKNILLTCADARQLIELFEADVFSYIYMHFPVPWNDSPTRRAINMPFVNELTRILKQDGCFGLRSDDRVFFDDSLALFLQLPHAKVNVIKNSQLDVISKYEQRWREQNKDIYDLIFTCDKNISLIERENNCDFSFEGEFDLDKIKESFVNSTSKFDGFFVRISMLFEGKDGQDFLVLRASMGDFFAPCSVYVRIEANKAYYLKIPPKTKANAKAHEKLKEYLACQTL